jgi:stage V sporulation protein AD
MIVTGDLGKEGGSILCELLHSEGLDIKHRYADCGTLIYDCKAQDKHAGGSGCGCSATVLAANILPNIKNGTLRDVLFIGTGALMNTMSLNQGQTIPGIAHLVHISAERDG